LHLGNMRTALAAWLLARAAGSEFLLRIEDLDASRCRPVYVDSILDDLRFLGLHWDGPVLFQSQRTALYGEALAMLAAKGHVYPCTCSRADVQRAVGAPHAAEEGPRYPGTCAHGVVSHPGRASSLRFRATPGPTAFIDALHGVVREDVAAAVGDFVVCNAQGVASYQLAVVVDDAAQGVEQVVRGDDLLGSTARQLQVYAALGLPAPVYAHVPLLLGADGQRLAKREGAMTVQALRARGFSAERLVGLLAHTFGLGDGGPVTAEAVAASFNVDQLSRTPVQLGSVEFDG
jgi:glutamyl-tRNA synthetase